MGAVEESRARVVIVDGDAEVTVAHLHRSHPDLALVDALARLQLAARRRGWSLHLRDPCDELSALLDLVGLAGVIAGVVAGKADLAFEAGREAEGGEQLDVEEVVQPRDPSP